MADFMTRHDISLIKKMAKVKIEPHYTTCMFKEGIHECTFPEGFNVTPELKEEDVEFSLELPEVTQVKEKVSHVEIKHDSDAVPVVRLANAIIARAIINRASDIHLEPNIAGAGSVRYRIDGILYEMLRVPEDLFKPIVQRIKNLARLPTTQGLAPLDGRMKLKVGELEVFTRISCIHTLNGEKLTLRLFERKNFFSINQLGFDNGQHELFEDLIKQPQGIILVTGPTGSGKTTTLYAALKKLTSPEINIVTIEDPVEFDIGSHVTQIQVTKSISFATGLRSILRQDPDIIMVGEIRDKETAEIAVQAAQTGHLVLSTLHTNDAPTTVARLMVLGIDPFLIASTLLCICSQRLIRKRCIVCGATLDSCPNCGGLGYKGREGIFELLTPSDTLRTLMFSQTATDELISRATKEVGQTLHQQAVKKVEIGVTTEEEMLRVAPPKVGTTW